MEIILFLGVIASIIWIVLKVRSHDRSLEKAALDQAWRIVLDDPHYAARRVYEERRHEDEARLRRETEGL